MKHHIKNIVIASCFSIVLIIASGSLACLILRGNVSKFILKELATIGGFILFTLIYLKILPFEESKIRIELIEKKKNDVILAAQVYEQAIKQNRPIYEHVRCLEKEIESFNKLNEQSRRQI
jgi:hypothetical protein